MKDFIEQILQSADLPKNPSSLYEPVEYALSGGGKRLRPLILLETVKGLGGVAESCYNQCTAIEMFHNFTLLHDDVMDKSDMRRGRPSVAAKWNENTAILSGDAMLTLATQLMMKCSDRHLRLLLDLFNNTALRVYEGQSFDMEFESRTNVTITEYLEMIRLKTSELIACALMAGAILCDASPKVIGLLRTYGLKLGEAFQLRDDFLDTFGDSATFGKKIGGDILNNKKTYLSILALERDKSGIIKDAFDNKLHGDKKIEKVTEIYRELALDKEICDEINKNARMAIGVLEEVPFNREAINFFTELAQKLALRQN